MDENNYSYEQLFGTLPSEYRMWYTTQLLTMFDGQNNLEHEASGSSDIWQAQTVPAHDSNLVEGEYSTSSMHESSPLCEDSATQSPSNFDTPEPASSSQWNYLYYLQMLSEMEQEKRFAHLSSNSQVTTDNSTNDSNPDPNLNVDEPSGAKPSELYSSKVKKGLESKREEVAFENTEWGTQGQSATAKPKVFPDGGKPKDEPKVAGSNSKKPLKRTKQLFEEDDDVLEDKTSEGNLFCKNCKSCSSPILNNSFTRVPCPSGNKCLLNVNNNLNKKCKSEPKIDAKESSSRKLEEIFFDKKPSLSSVQKNRKVKVRSKEQLSDEIDPIDPNLNCDPKNKKRSVTSKSRIRLGVRGKLPRHNQRKRYSDVEKESTMENMMGFFRVVTEKLSQLPSQPWFKHTLDALTSLIGVIVGSVWLLVFIIWEGLKSGYKVSKRWASSGFLWMRINGSFLVQMLFLYIPGLGSGTSNKTNDKEETTSGEKLPTNGNDAVRRLLHLKGQDPYSILGIGPSASDEDIKKRYKSQAVLVHPDKNHFTGAEEAFKVLASAFDILGNSEKRSEYDQEHNLKEEGDEITSFLEKIQKNIEEMQSILGCQSCGKSHKRYKTERHADNARYCSSCKTFHAAREGDLWAETTMLGFKWHYYAYLDKAIFDITEWVTCQENLMSTVEANSHSVTCRLSTPKGKNRNGTYSRMQDLKDLVNDLLQKSRQPGQEAAGPGAGARDSMDRNGKQERSTEPPRGKGGRRHSGLSGGRKRK